MTPKDPISPNESRRKPRAHARQMQTPIEVLSRTQRVLGTVMVGYFFPSRDKDS